MMLQYWFLFPVSIVIAPLAMSSGRGGATFFRPLFIMGALFILIVILTIGEVII